ncbi:MAG TPA: endolytic transglycosylase MltG [Acidimicrobiaceae bacterium]|nr:endolytic transglycosylase MltG [Acidimicrobiaceae bacterium]
MTFVDETAWQSDPWDDPDETDALVIERTRRQFRPVKWLMFIVCYAALAGVVVAGAYGLWYTQKVNPAGDPGAAVNFTVTDDDTFETVAQRLYDEGLISDIKVFDFYVRQNGGLELTPGYYSIRPNDHMGNVMRILRTPPSETYTKVTFPEGYTIERMAARLADEMPRLQAVDFTNGATDGSVEADWLPAGINSLEGLLFPDTYQISNGESEREVLQRMVDLMERVGRQEDIEQRSAQIGFTPYQVLIIASLIEREAKVPEDRAKIARVIYNRLFFGVPLQIDASLYYQQDQSLSFSQLKEIDSPYNTYLYSGLPPTPIANPGRASIQAALNPVANPSIGDPICRDLAEDEPCLYMYYVIADEEGRHVFAATYEQHLANIEEARRKGLL